MNEIFAYYQAICDGSVVVGKWIRKWYEYIVNGLEKGSFFFSAKKAKAAIGFIEGFCRHHEGALAPNLIKLELWQKALISVLFGILDSDGYRLFRECLILVGRKNGKTLLAAAISAYMGIMDGEYGARLYFCSTKLEQANLCYNAFYQMLDKDEELSKLKVKRRSDVYFPATNTSAKPLAYSAQRSDGLNCHFVCADEIAAWKGDAGIKFYEVLKSSFGARKQPLLMCISTAGYQNDGIFDELMKRATAVLQGTSKETRFAPFIYQIDDIEKWNDITELQKSNPNLGVSISVNYLLEEIAVAENSLSRAAEFKTKYCNIKQSSSQAWFEYQDVAKCMGVAVDPCNYQHRYAVGGVDLSQTTDLTSACVVLEDKGKLHVFSHFWMPHSRIDKATEEDGVPYRQMMQRGFLSLSGDNYIDYKDIVNWYVDFVKKWEILPLVIGFDRYSATYFCDDMRKLGFHMDDVRQGTNLTPCIRELDALVKDGKMDFGNNSMLQAHILNSALKTDEEAQKCRLVKISKTARIDGMAALLDAICVRQAHNAEIGSQLKNGAN